MRAASPASTAVEEPETKDEDDAKPDDLRARATAFMAPAAAQTPEDAMSTPRAGETLAVFYARSRTYWAQRALTSGASDQRGKMLRRDGFALAEERYREYKPLLDEVERILAEAGLDEDEMRRSGASGGGAAAAEGNRNRR